MASTSRPRDHNQTEPATSDENRAAPRRRQLKSATLIFNDVSSVVSCRVRDISDTGAGVECESTQHLPDNLILKISDGRIFDCVVIRRTATQLGLKFKENRDLERLMTEITDLRARLSGPFDQLLATLARARNEDAAKIGHPRINTHLNKLSDKADDFLAAYEEMLKEFGSER